MKFLPVLVLFLSFAYGCRVYNRTDYLDCFSTIFDLDHDAVITVQEIDTVLSRNYDLSHVRFNGTMIVHECDMNNDSVLTVAGDWNNQTSCLVPSEFLGWSLGAMFTCDVCVQNGWVVPVPPQFKRKTATTQK